MFFSGIKKDTYTLSSTQVIEGDFFLLQEKLMTPGAFVIAKEKGFISSGQCWAKVKVCQLAGFKFVSLSILD